MQSYLSSPESPMNLGSPTSSSAAAAAAANAASPSAHYLPGYLLGDYPSIGLSPATTGANNVVHSGLVNRSWLGNPSVPGVGSPPKALHLSTSSQFASPPPNNNPYASRSPGRVGVGMQLLPSPSVVGRKDFKPGAPPTAGLFDHLQTSPTSAHNTTPVNGAPSSRFIGAEESSFYGAESNSFAAAGIEGEEFWVTVFGFPPAAASFILQQFSQFGNILKHVIAPNGNWMHLQYQSRIQAQKALSKNGKVFGNNIMVGVSECGDQNVATSGSISALHHDVSLTAGNSFCSPSTNLVSSSLAGGSSASFSAGNASRTRAMRPLTSSSVLNSSVRDERDVINDANNPKKSSGLISKTVDYLFGW